MEKYPALRPFIPAKEKITEIIEQLYDLLTVEATTIKYDELPDFYKESWKVIFRTGIKDPIYKITIAYGEQQVICYMDASELNKHHLPCRPRVVFSFFIQSRVYMGIGLSDLRSLHFLENTYIREELNPLREFLGEEIWKRLLESQLFT
jgi:hypothetical protein